MKGKAVLHYWRAHGRAETSRMLLWLGRIPYENRFSPSPSKEPEAWAETKKKLEFGALPMLEIDGLKLVQSKAIERYLIAKMGMEPISLKERYLVDSMLYLH